MLTFSRLAAAAAPGVQRKFGVYFFPRVNIGLVYQWQY